MLLTHLAFYPQAVFQGMEESRLLIGLKVKKELWDPPRLKFLPYHGKQTTRS